MGWGPGTGRLGKTDMGPFPGWSMQPGQGETYSSKNHTNEYRIMNCDWDH